MYQHSNAPSRTGRIFLPQNVLRRRFASPVLETVNLMRTLPVGLRIPRHTTRIPTLIRTLFSLSLFLRRSAGSLVPSFPGTVGETVVRWCAERGEYGWEAACVRGTSGNGGSLLILRGVYRRMTVFYSKFRVPPKPVARRSGGFCSTK